MGHLSRRRRDAPEPSTYHDLFGGVSTRLLRFVLALAATTCAVAAIAPDRAWGRPAVEIRDTTVAVGGTTIVTGTGWPAQTLVEIETCGNLGLDGSADCALASALNVGTSRDGRVSTVFTVTQPPTPCPCVVRVNTLDFSNDARTPITITGAPTSAPRATTGAPEISRYLRIADAHLEGTPSWTRWFGAGYWRTLALTIRNVGDAAVDTPQLAVTFGTSEHPTGIVDAPRLAALGPGESTVVRVPVHIDALSIGTHHVRAEISGFGRPAATTISTSTYPWGLLAVAIVVVQLVLLGVRNWVRRRVHHGAADDEVETAPDDAGPGAADLRDVQPVVEDASEAPVAEPVPFGYTTGVSGDAATATAVLVDTAVAPQEGEVDVMPEEDQSLASLRETLVTMLGTVDALIARAAEGDARSAELDQARADADALRLEAHEVLDRAHAEARAIVEQARRSVLDALESIRDPAVPPRAEDSGH